MLAVEWASVARPMHPAAALEHASSRTSRAT